MKKVFAVFACLLLWPMSAVQSADDVRVVLRLDRTEATLSDTVRMEIRVSGARSIDDDPTLQNLESFLVTKGGASSRVEIINSKVNSGIDYTYYIQAKKTGTFKIGPAMITVDDKIFASNTSTLTIGSTPQSSGADRGPVFMNASVSSGEIYVDQQIFYTLKFYYRVRVGDLSLNLPEITHVNFKQLGRPFEYQSNVEGQSYQVLEIRYALTSSKPGDYIIHPSRMKMTVQQSRSRSLFDSFFNDPFSGLSSGRPLTIATDSIELRVNPLPLAGKPADFTGLVGNFQMISTLAPDRLKAGESATLTVAVKGKGTVNRIPDIHLPDLDFARTYSDQPVLETEESREGIRGTKTMKWALVPENAGEFKVPSLSLSYFDPETKQYHVLHTPAHMLSVSPGEADSTATSTPSSGIDKTAEEKAKKEIQQLGEDILPIHTDAVDLSVPFRSFSRGWNFWFILLGPLSLYSILLAALKLRHISPERLRQTRSKRAFSILKRRCRTDQPSYEGLIDAFKDYLKDRFGLSIGALTADDAKRILKDQGLDTKTADKIHELIQRFESAIYTGKSFNEANAADELLRLIKIIEKEIS